MNRDKTRDMVLASVFIGIIMLMTLVPQIGYIILPSGASLTLIHIPVLIGIFILRPKYALTIGIVFGLSSFVASYIYATNLVDLAFRNPLISVLPRALFGAAAFGIFKGFEKLSTFKKGKEVIFGLISIVTIFVSYYGILALVKTFGGSNTETLTQVFTPISLILAGAIIAVFYAYIKNKYEQALVVPATLALSTLVHTVLVIGALFIFSSGLEAELGTELIPLLGAVIGGNGLLEILLAVLIGTPLYMTLKKVQTQN